MYRKNTCVLLYSSPQAAEQGIEKLQIQAFNMKTVSILSKGFQNEAHPLGLYISGEQLHFMGIQATFWESLWSRLNGASFFWLPDFGPIAAAGPIVSLLVQVQESIEVGGGFNVLVEALFNMGIPRDSIIDYEKAVKAGKIMFIVHGMRTDAERACFMLHSETQQVTVHMA